MDNIQIQDQDNTLINESIQQAPIFSFLESKVQKRFDDVTRAKVQMKLKQEHSKRKENVKQEAKYPYQLELIGQKQIENDYILYQIKVTCGSQSWIFQTRYSLLLNLHEKLPSNLKKRMTQFPCKKYFGNHDQAFLQKRYQRLQSYLKNIFSCEEAKRCQDLNTFMKQGKMAAIKMNDHMQVNSFSLDY